MLLDCFHLGIIYTPVQKFIIIIITHNPKLFSKHVDPVTKSPKWLKLSPNKKIGPRGWSFLPSDMTSVAAISLMGGF